MASPNPFSTRKPLVVFRANGGPSIGNGHIVRCSALARQLKERGWFTLLAASETTFSTVPQANKFDRTLRLSGDTDQFQRLSAAITGKANLLVVDDYTQDIRFEQASRAWAHKILVIDDLANRRHDADFIVDSAAESTASYDSLVPEHCQRFIGPQWALLRPEFSAKRKTVLKRRQLNTAVERILIAIGGSDGRKLTPSLISAVKSATAGLRVSLDVVLGGQANSLAAVRKMQSREPSSFDLHVDTNMVASLMSSADVGIGACGVGSWERCAVGLPTIGVITAENQKSAAAILSNAGAAHIIGEWTEITKAQVETAIASLLNKPGARQIMGVAASTLCDGEGIYRLSTFLDRNEIR